MTKIKPFLRMAPLLILLLFATTSYADINSDLIKAAGVGDTAKVEQLLKQGADVNAKDEDGRTALMGAAIYGRTEVVKALIDAGADVNAKDGGGETPLYVASVWGHTDTVKALIHGGANVNAKDKYGGTALSSAAIWGHTDIVKVLIDVGADVNAEEIAEKINRTSFPGMESEHKDIVRLLKQTMARRHMVRGQAAVEIARTWQDYEIAIQEFEQAAELAPDWPEIYCMLGLVQVKAGGQYGEAIENLEKYLALAPNASHAEQVRELIYKVEKAKRELLNPNSLVGIWWPNSPRSDDDKAYRFEIRNNNGRVEARALTELFWEVHRPKGRFVPIQWDGKTLRISRAVYYGCHSSVRPDCCPCEATYNLIRVSVDKLEGEVEVSGIYESASGTKHFTFKYKLVWIRRK